VSSFFRRAGVRERKREREREREIEREREREREREFLQLGRKNANITLLMATLYCLLYT
jgi:hypothetical protein